MSNAFVPTPSALSVPVLQVRFLSILPRIELHGRISFRFLPCPHQRADAVSEVVARAGKWHLRLAERGKDATRFPSTLADYAARAVRAVAQRPLALPLDGRQLLAEAVRRPLHPDEELVDRLPELAGQTIAEYQPRQ